MNCDKLLHGIEQVQTRTLGAAARAVNQLLTMRNWLIGAYIIEFEQNGEDRAVYGDELLERLALDLRQRGIKSISSRNLWNFRQFTLAYPTIQILQTLSAEFTKEDPDTDFGALLPSLVARGTLQPPLEWQDVSYFTRLFSSLTWSHLLELTRIDNPLKRAFYELESMKSGWSFRELKRQINSMLYERVGLSHDKDAVLALSAEGRIVRHHHLDLLFFHRSLRCLVAFDLKLGTFEHSDAGQMNVYLNYLHENEAHPDENPPVGILLCAEKNAETVRYAMAGIDQQLFVSRYMVELPSEEQLREWLKQETEQIYRVRETGKYLVGGHG